MTLPFALPFILAGPIVRRVEPNLVTVWVAVSVFANVNLKVYDQAGVDATSPPSVAFESGPKPTTKFGERFHVIAATAEPAVAMTPDTTYSYNLEFDIIGTSPHAGAHDLRTLGLLEDETDAQNRTQIGVDPAAPLNKALGYATDQLPTFRTCPSDLSKLVLVQAGCRNSSSTKHDGARWIDKVILDGMGGLESKRPHQLFLTGDQIYADSANTILLPMMNQLGAEMLGAAEGESWTETMLAVLDGTAAADHPGANKEIPLTMDNFPAGRRGWLCQDHGRLTTGASSHLLAYGEFLGAYCLAWNPSVWRQLATEQDIYYEEPPNPDQEFSVIEDYLTTWDKIRTHKGKVLPLLSPEWQERRRLYWERFQTRAVPYREAIAEVRRALANTPTYMIHDDHEVSDDWNTSKDWMQRTYSRPLGRQLLRNALSAYAIFQAWGNDPKGWETNSAKSAFLADVAAAWTSSSVDEDFIPNDTITGQIEARLGVGAQAGSSFPEVEWHYKVQEPAHQIVAIDTRTKRTFKARVSSAKLLGTTTKTQIPNRVTSPADDRLLVLLAPQPPLMPALFDQIAQPVAGAIVSTLAERANEKKKARDAERDESPRPHELKELGENKLEGESWGLEQYGLEELLGHLEQYKKVVMLSGDVHFSYGMTMDYWKRTSTTPARYVQLTLSPSRHQWPAMVHILLRTSSLVNRVAELGHPAERVAWASPSSVPDVAIPAGLTALAKGTPALLPARGWPEGTTFKTDPDTGRELVPDWSWRLDVVTDQRAEAKRPISLPPLEAVDPLPIPPDPPPGVPPTEVVAEPIFPYADLAAKHQSQIGAQFSHLRRLVFPTALGIITFPVMDDGNGDRQYVQHDIWTADPNDPTQVNLNLDGEPNTVHLIELEPTADPRVEVQEKEDGS